MNSGKAIINMIIGSIQGSILDLVFIPKASCDPDDYKATGDKENSLVLT